jgi:hypothetical protein
VHGGIRRREAAVSQAPALERKAFAMMVVFALEIAINH